MVALLWIGLLLVLAGCSHPPAAPDAARPHHGPDGFRNRYQPAGDKGFGEFLRWRLQAWQAGLPKPPAEPVPTVQADVAWLKRNAAAGPAMQPSVTWIGHASALVQADGLNVLIDPVFSERASPVSFGGPRRAQPPGLVPAQLPRIDLVLISHNHYDHLDVASVQALAAQPGGPPRFLVPLGVKAWFADLGITAVDELDWWQTRRIGAVEVMFTPAQHWSGRGLFDRRQTLWGGFALLGPRVAWFYSGDTGYSPDFRDIHTRLAARLPGQGFDLALLPVGAYEPRWFMAAQHVNPAEAVRIHQDVRSRLSIGVHWGTFELTDEPLDQPPRDLAEARRAAGIAAEAFRVLAVGQTLQIPLLRP